MSWIQRLKGMMMASATSALMSKLNRLSGIGQTSGSYQTTGAIKASVEVQRHTNEIDSTVSLI